MRQRRWVELLKDYDCESPYHPGKANVVAGALSRKTHFNAIRISSDLYVCIREAQYSSANEGSLTAEVHGAHVNQLETKSDGLKYYRNRIWVPDRDNLRELIMNEAHKSRYSIHPGADKMYQDLCMSYWWPGMKKDIVIYVSKFLTCSKVKAEHQRPSVLLVQPEIPVWKWELPRTPFGHDSIWVIVDPLTKSAHFLPIREDYKVEKLARIYTDDIICHHGIALDIISDIALGKPFNPLWVLI